VNFLGGKLTVLDGGSEISAMVRARGWAATPLGLAESWPAELYHHVGVMLSTAQSMAVASGQEARTILYNDLYAELIRPPR
jgi:hypothetical protein